MPTHRQPDWTEIVDDDAGILLRRIVVGPLDTNCYTITAASSTQTVIVDPGADAPAILDAVHDLDVVSIVLTHAHFDHVEALAEVADALGAPVAAHPADAPVWPGELDHLRRHGHFDAGQATEDLLAAGCSLCPAEGALEWDGRVDDLLEDGRRIVLAGDQRRSGASIDVIHTPGHTPGGVSLRIGGHVLTGDTLFPGGPGLTGWPLSDFDTIIGSVRSRLLTLPSSTRIHPGHGRSTDVGSERPHLPEWMERGW